jgi:hypothetical protein
LLSAVNIKSIIVRVGNLEGIMKRLIVLVSVLVFCGVSLAFAEWLVDFRDIYVKEGIDPAVVEALKQGAGPEQIMENGLQLEGLNPQNLVKAMYCAGMRGDDIRTAGNKYGVTDIIIVAGYKKSVEECGDQVVDTQAYTPIASVISFAGPPAPGGGISASPATF